jgi:nucleotide-binding universal stress UspA family protein
MDFSRHDNAITLLHIFRKATAEEALMGKKFSAKQQPRMLEMLQRAKNRLTAAGYDCNAIEIKLITEQFPTVADGIISQCKSENYHMVFIGRKQMSKSEEFALGDISVKLIRTLEDMAIIVVKTNKISNC